MHRRRRSATPDAVYLAGLAPTGRTAMLSKLQRVAEMLGAENPLQLPWQNLRYQHVAAIRARLIQEGLAPSTVNATLCALRRIAQEAYRLGLMEGQDYQRLKQAQGVRGERLPAGRALSTGEATALLDACANDHTPAGARDAAVIALMYGAGLCRAEVVALDLEDYDPQTG